MGSENDKLFTLVIYLPFKYCYISATKCLNLNVFSTPVTIFLESHLPHMNSGEITAFR